MRESKKALEGMHNEGLHNLHFTQNCYGDKVEEGEMGGTCNNHGTEEKCLCFSIRICSCPDGQAGNLGIFGGREKYCH